MVPIVTSGPAQGSLLIHGGGDLDEDFRCLLMNLAGGPNTRFVCIPTALEDGNIGNSMANSLGFTNLTSIHTRERATANEENFVSPLLTANAVFIAGGRQPRLADAYLNTRTQRELSNLLDRGGVIAGTSAGATIQGSFLVRNQGVPDYNPDVMIDWNYTMEGFGFIKNVAIDQHITKRGRENDLAEVLKTHPELLGIGIDEETAIHVQRDEFKVIGKGLVFVHSGSDLYRKLSPGQKFDLRTRSVI